MSNTTGANIEELAKLGQSFERQSQTVGELADHLEGMGRVLATKTQFEQAIR